MKTSLILLLLLSVLGTVLEAQTKPQAQIQALQKNPDVVWMCEFNSDYLLGNTQAFRLSEPLAEPLRMRHQLGWYYDLVKIFDPYCQGESPGEFFKEALLDSTLEAYGDWDLQQRLNKTQLEAFFTVLIDRVNFDPKLNQEVKIQTPWRITGENCLGIIVRQVMYYNQKTGMFYLQPLAISPILPKRNEKTQAYEWGKSFWLAIEVAEKPLALDAPKYSYAESVRGRFVFEDLRPMKQIKSIEVLIPEHLNQIRKLSKEIFAIDGSQRGDLRTAPMSPAAIEAAYALERIDSLITFDPETLQERQELRRRPRVPQLQSILFSQFFAWDSQRKTLVVQQHAFSLLEKQIDDNGNTLGLMPLLYLFPHKPFR